MNFLLFFQQLLKSPTNSTNLLKDHRLLPKCTLATKVLAHPLRNYRNPSPGPKAETNDSATAPRALNALGTPTVATAPITIRLARGHRSIPCNTVRSSQCCAGRSSRGVAPVAQSTSTLWLKCRCDGLRRRAANAAVALQVVAAECTSFRLQGPCNVNRGDRGTLGVVPKYRISSGMYQVMQHFAPLRPQ